MKPANADFTVWLIIAIIVTVSKLWNKFATGQPEEDEQSPAPPPVRPRTRPAPRPAVPLHPVIREFEQGSSRNLREFMTARAGQPQPKPAPPPRVPKVVEPTAKPPPAVAKKASPPPRRESIWVEALRDRQNLRNIIISAEIIGPPRGV